MGLRLNDNIVSDISLKNKTESSSFLKAEIVLFNNFGDKKKEIFYSDLDTLLSAGVDLKLALEIIIEEQEKKQEKKLYENIYNDLVVGVSLSESLNKSGKFSSYEIFSVSIGEESNNLVPVLKELSRHYKEKIELKKQIISVLSYPLFVLLITIGIVYFMLGSVVPMFKGVFKQFGSELPKLTQNIIYISENFSLYILIFSVLVSAITLFIFQFKKEIWFRKFFSSITLKIPYINKLVSKVYLARMIQSMYLLLVTKTPMVKTLDLTEKMVGFYPLELAINNIRSNVEKGESLNAIMKRHSIFPSRLVSLIKVGEEVNKLDEMLMKISEQYREELKHETNIIGKIMEPLILLIIGSVVGVILVAMYMPMFNLSNMISQ